MSDIDPESITFIDCNEETNGSGTGSFNASLRWSEDAEESSSSSLKAMKLYNGSFQNQSSPIGDLDETAEMKLESTPNERKRTKEEFAKFAESIAIQLAEIPDSYSRSVAKLRIDPVRGGDRGLRANASLTSATRGHSDHSIRSAPRKERKWRPVKRADFHSAGCRNAA